MRFAGTLSVAPRLYADLVEAVVHWVVQHGVRKVLLLNGHGGNEASVQLALRELKTGLASRGDALVTAAS
jgi:creatinine amidohydrolase